MTKLALCVPPFIPEGVAARPMTWSGRTSGIMGDYRMPLDLVGFDPGRPGPHARSRRVRVRPIS
jgi:hypothetical protein